MELFIEISIIIAITTLFAVLMRYLRQPLIIGYILTGIFAGPYFFDLVNSPETFAMFSQIGISMLLFVVGLGLNPKVIKEVGKASLVTGIGQVIFTSIPGYFICRFFGFSSTASLYISVALTFSSTIIIMKLLSDKGDADALYGRIATGFLIVQDVIAILMLMAVSSSVSGSTLQLVVVDTLIRGITLISILFYFGYFALPALTTAIAKSQELLMLFSIAWVFVVASLFSYFQLSMEIGALLAGITLSFSPYRFEISSRMRPLRDFFIVLFFIMLGAQMGFSDIRSYVFPIVALSLFVLIGNPLIMFILMGLLGFTKRTGFLVGLTVAQISEFSLILIAAGVKMGYLPENVLSIVTAVGLITIAGSSYLILYSNKIYPYFADMLSIFEKKGQKVDEHNYQAQENYDVILFGYNRIGYDLLKTFKKLHTKFLIVDYNPDTIIGLAKQGFECRYGDAGDVELLNDLNFSKTKMVVSTVPELDTNLLLIRTVRESNKKAVIIVVSHQIEEAIELYEKGASYVITPHFLGGIHTSMLIERYGFNINLFMKEQIQHIKNLKERKKYGQELPKHEKQEQKSLRNYVV
jgi:Kef-type K+ transport system membrane component KefB/Trk K+ transport system NAD-binding subunit